MSEFNGTFDSAAPAARPRTMTFRDHERGRLMRAQVIGQRLEWWCEADGATLFVDAEQPVLDKTTLRFVAEHSAHDGALYERAPRNPSA